MSNLLKPDFVLSHVRKQMNPKTSINKTRSSKVQLQSCVIVMQVALIVFSLYF